MIKIENNNYSIIENLKKSQFTKRNKIIYKNNIYNLFRYNENAKKKIQEKNNDNRKIDNFNSVIKIMSTPIKNKPLNNILLHNNNTQERNKKSYINNILPFYTNTNNNKSRNKKNFSCLINTDSSSLSKLITSSRINKTETNNINKKNNGIFLNSKIKPKLNTEILEKINNYNINKKYNKYFINCNIDKNIIKRLVSQSYKNRLNTIKNKNLNDFDKIKIYTPNKKHKVILFRDVNDMKPINRFNILRRELLHEEHKINKMFMNYKTQISKNEMINKWISAKNKTTTKK